MSARDKRLEKAQTRVIFTVPFYAPAVARLPVTFDASIDTACTDGTGIKWNPGFFDTLTDAQLVTVLCHEASHCLLGHGWRAPEGADWEQWNIACDHAVNLMLKEFSATVTAKGLADPFPFPEPADAYCADPVFAGMAEEVIYRAIARKQPPSPQPQSGGGGSKQSQGGGGKSAPGQKSGAPASGHGPGKGSMPSFGQIEKPAPGSEAAGKALASDWEGTLLQSCKIAQGQGLLPAGMERYVDALVNPKVAWWELLRSWLREQCADDWNWLAPAMEYEGSGFILPSLQADRCGPIVFATDTSGSINQDLLAQFQTEKQQCLDTMRPRKLVDIYCDARIHKVEEYAVGDTITRQCPGGGGTDFRPVFNHVRNMPETIKALVYLTDLCGSFPEEDPGYPVIWVTWEKGGQAPFGMVVYAGD